MTEAIVVDTNVAVSAIRSPDGAARAVLRACLRREAVALMGNALFLDYEDVMARETLFSDAPIGPEGRAALVDSLFSVARWVSVSFLWRPNLRGERDTHLVQLAMAGNARAVVTGTARDLIPAELRFGRLRVLSPAQWLSERP